ncbi:Uma2 family endonuclease [Flammeovirgaceae bacterium SG7u.111]|nr:Uma2 family endonuclease [Flammeovirgaceae bacterium SG7u.132]WPO36404.1 Uma2 family endonuclease [Flammeovirgaceae bacterium SG7u.111]
MSNKHSLTISDYVSLEQETGVKYEFHDGEVFALAGGSLNHGLLCGNVYSELRNGLKTASSNCKPLTSEIKLHVETQNSFLYPDCMVVCDKLAPSRKDKNAVVNPILVVEVLSKSTADYDRGDKFYQYRQIPSLQEYVLIEQDKAVVEVYFKKPKSDLWKISRYEGLSSRVQLQSIGIEISIEELYFDVEGVL